MREDQRTRALRLADALDELDSAFSATGVCGEAADLLRELAAEPAACDCHACESARQQLGMPASMPHMVLCPTCGNKRCPKASNHNMICTGSNDPNQPGSIYSTAEPVRVPMTDEQGIALANAVSSPNDATWIRDPDQCVLRIVRATEVAHGITGGAK